MKKLVLIAALLLFPAMALADTVIDYNNVVVSTDFETSDGWVLTTGATDTVQEQDADGHEWGGGGANWIIDDPTGAGRGQVVQFGGNGLGSYRLYCDRRDVEWVVTHPKGTTYIEWDVYFTSNLFTPGDLTNSAEFGYGPMGVLWADPSGETYADEFDLYDGGGPWNYPNIPTVAAPFPGTEVWMTIRCEFDNATYDCDYYIDGIQYGDNLAEDWHEDNSFHIQLNLEDAGMETVDCLYLDRVQWWYEVPEPSVFVIGGLGLLALLRRKKK